MYINVCFNIPSNIIVCLSPDSVIIHVWCSRNFFLHSSSSESFPQFVKFDILMAGNVKIVFFLSVTLCKLVERHEHFGGMCSLSLSLLKSGPEAGNMVRVYDTTLHLITEHNFDHATCLLYLFKMSLGSAAIVCSCKDVKRHHYACTRHMSSFRLARFSTCCKVSK